MKNYRGKIHTYIHNASNFRPGPPCFSLFLLAKGVCSVGCVAVGLMFVLLSGKEGWGRVFRVLISYNYYELTI